MAEIEIGPLADRLADDELAELGRKLEKLGVTTPPSEDDSGATTLASVDGDVLIEFLDRLEAEDLACDIYLPAEFEGRIEVGDYRVGSVSALVDVLEALKDELAPDEDEDAEDEDDDDADEAEYADMKLIEAKLARLWKQIYDGAQTALERRLPLYVLSD
jgi:hypothetical protein